MAQLHNQELWLAEWDSVSADICRVQRRREHCASLEVDLKAKFNPPCKQHHRACWCVRLPLLTFWSASVTELRSSPTPRKKNPKRVLPILTLLTKLHVFWEGNYTIWVIKIIAAQWDKITDYCSYCFIVHEKKKIFSLFRALIRGGIFLNTKHVLRKEKKIVVNDWMNSALYDT